MKIRSVMYCSFACLCAVAPVLFVIWRALAHDKQVGRLDAGRFVQVVRTSTPIWGSVSGGDGHALLLARGYQGVGSQRFNIAHRPYSLLESWVGWLKGYGIGRNAEGALESKGNVSVSVACPEIPAGMYSYPVSFEYYNRYAVPSAPQRAATPKFVDRYVGSGIAWSKPQPDANIVPVYNPDAPEPIPAPFN